jgi:sugar lactone lactonase YvrE
VSTEASFSSLAAIADPGTGTYYITDSGNHAIRTWNGSNVETLAGDGSPGFVDGYQTSARFMIPGKSTADSAGNLYVADIGNNAIRKIDPAGYVTTAAGGGPTSEGHVDGQGSNARLYRPTSIVFNPADNMLYIADSHNNCIRRMDQSGNVTTYAGTGVPGLVNGSLSQAQFDKPTDLIIRNGFMYISDSMNNAIRRIDMANGIVMTYIT